MEYQCVYLSELYKLAHEPSAEILFESDSLAQAGSFVYNSYLKNGRDIAVWQPRISMYRQVYREPARDAKGRYAKR